MASAVLSEIERIKQNELLAAFSRNEAAMLEKLVPAPRRDLAEHKEYLGPFIEWCTRHTVRHCQARPQTVATFIAEHAHRGEQFALNTIQAIEALHDYHRQAQPSASQLVRLALASIVKPDPPRSWTKAEKEMFASLPPDIRAAVNRRETHREKELRRMQNELAEIRKKTTNAESKTETESKGPERTGEQSGPVEVRV